MSDESYLFIGGPLDRERFTGPMPPEPYYVDSFDPRNPVREYRPVTIRGEHKTFTFYALDELSTDAAIEQLIASAVSVEELG